MLAAIHDFLIGEYEVALLLFGGVCVVFIVCLVILAGQVITELRWWRD